ncbi:TM2 domain containing 2 [Phyllostomus discolor]|uniref:TM2 domain containing 2 n=1 Tax=Phyllostomus discolor TaxID=89673 RepID=A0A833Z2G7_9CHIR|nr:TM2 domain containing 2 [Phyllostomus discolor]
MVLGGCPVSYLLLCGQAALLLGNLLLLHCVSRSHSYNATAEPELTSAGATNPEFVGASSWEYGDPNSPVILCSYLPDEFIECEDPVDHVGNATASQELGYGCLKFLLPWLSFHSSVVRPTAMWNTQPSSAAPWTGLSVPVLGPSCERINLA